MFESASLGLLLLNYHLLNAMTLYFFGFHMESPMHFIQNQCTMIDRPFTLQGGQTIFASINTISCASVIKQLVTIINKKKSIVYKNSC